MLDRGALVCPVSTFIAGVYNHQVQQVAQAKSDAEVIMIMICLPNGRPIFGSLQDLVPRPAERLAARLLGRLCPELLCLALAVSSQAQPKAGTANIQVIRALAIHGGKAFGVDPHAHGLKFNCYKTLKVMQLAP